ncbi:3'-5' exonuclease [Qipengyuania sp. 6B39]|uniref:3'-5' exonuclease n=1 Tax=Qipengyuania proteolytica TaxID=2867239 RepID=UPI001C89813A|nr:3'-5' exonuclease [Qipengyuania proteolytica]MBX7496790.1 3'-5' exonuclease [Qipengyuania proteolytica]
MELLLVLAVGGLAWWWLRKGKGPAPKGADISMLPDRFVVFDLETTGLDPEKHEIIEIGAIKVERDASEHLTFATLVVPQGRISSRITELTGINRAMVNADGLPLGEALSAFREFVEDLPLVAYNADFDVAFLKSACARCEQETFRNRVTCALKLARRAWPGRDSYRLSALCEQAGVQVRSEHRALPDCERAMLVYSAASSTLAKQV